MSQNGDQQQVPQVLLTIGMQVLADGSGAIATASLLGMQITQIVIPAQAVDQFVQQWLMMKKDLSKLISDVNRSRHD